MIIISYFLMTLSSTQISGNYGLKNFELLTEHAQRVFVESAQDCRSSWGAERFPVSNIQNPPAYWRRLAAGLKAHQGSADFDMFDLLDQLDRHGVHTPQVPDYPYSPRPYEPHGEHEYDFWEYSEEGQSAIVEAYLNCRVRYFGATPRRTVSDYRHMIDDWYGLADFEHPYDQRGKTITAKDIPVARQFAKVGDVLDRILAADDAAAKALRPAQTP